MKFRRLVVPLIVFGLPALAVGQVPTGTANGSAAEITAHQLLRGNERGVIKRSHQIVRSQQQLAMLLRQIYAGQVPPPAPRIDFSQQVLVYFTLGTGMYGGDRVYVRSGSLHDGTLHIKVEVAASGANCLGANSLTAPFALAALPFPAWKVQRADLTVTHTTYPCK